MSDEKKDNKVEKKDIKVELSEMTDLLKRNQAEFENYRKRVEKEKVDLIRIANKNLILKLLPILDNFELALQNKECSKEFVNGVELIFGQFYQLLDDEGLKPVETINKKFDPHFHEALLTGSEKDKENDIVIDELQKGYYLGDSLIRHAKVKINKKEE